MRFAIILVRFAIFLQLALIWESKASCKELEQLAQSAEWRKLLHYEAGSTIVQSRIDSPEFFLTKNGQTDPLGELRAALSIVKNRDDTAAFVCRFPARAAFIQQHLLPNLAFEPCPLLRHWVDTLTSDEVRILFASQYRGNPASRFGHTFLHFVRNSQFARRTIQATDPVVSYAAIVGDANPLEYAWNGLFGGFKGYFSVATLGETLRDYANMEDRSLWDYPLELTAKEREKLIYHLYELRGIWSWYWFTSENCAYQLIAVLEAVRPDLDVLADFHTYFLPIDTIHTLLPYGIVGNPKYFPSKGDLLRATLVKLSPAEKRIFDASIHQSALDTIHSAAVLDALIHYADYRSANTKTTRPEFATLQAQALNQRAKHPAVTASSPGPTRDPPHLAAGLGLLEAGFGRDQDGALTQLRGRVLAHDLLNSDQGLTPHEELSVLDTRLRYSNSRRQLDLEEIILLRNAVLDPVQFYQTPLSWDLLVSLYRRDEYGYGRANSLRVDPRIGISAGSSIVGFVLVSYLADGVLGRRDRFVSGPGLHAGIQADLSPIKANFAWRNYYARTGSRPGTRLSSMELGVSATISKNQQLSLTARRSHSFSRRLSEVLGSYGFLF